MQGLATELLRKASVNCFLLFSTPTTVVHANEQYEDKQIQKIIMIGSITECLLGGASTAPTFNLFLSLPCHEVEQFSAGKSEWKPDVQ